MTDVEVPFIAQNIVNQLGDLWEVPVRLRQATNDRADQFVAKLLADMLTAAEVKVLTEAALRLGRKEAGEEIAESLDALAASIGDGEQREFLIDLADTARDIASSPLGAPWDVRSGVGEGPGTPEAPKAPQARLAATYPVDDDHPAHCLCPTCTKGDTHDQSP